MIAQELNLELLSVVGQAVEPQIAASDAVDTGLSALYSTFECY